jgi:hypothetical protein
VPLIAGESNTDGALDWVGKKLSAGEISTSTERR